MANENLKGKKVAILVTDGFEQVELLQPREALDKAGAQTKVITERRPGKRLGHDEVGQGGPGRPHARQYKFG
jgi:putative intracellular protease/amidase